ncbi:hypothetical protein J437_LFUL012205 [Ladona fulva]|uniref:Uncharacterized protein n=1 Tax=Ladona fulva TaxID=123851 RepID=A0A8K0PAQ3_LADFU|nr:hypothetical protein J437_LFUL012205 [Ladona fulva]
MKKFLAGQHFATDGEVKSAVRRWLYSQQTDFFEQGILKLVPRWEKCVEKIGDYVENISSTISYLSMSTSSSFSSSLIASEASHTIFRAIFPVTRSLHPLQDQFSKDSAFPPFSHPFDSGSTGKTQSPHLSHFNPVRQAPSSSRSEHLSQLQRKNFE